MTKNTNNTFNFLNYVYIVVRPFSVRELFITGDISKEELTFTKVLCLGFLCWVSWSKPLRIVVDDGDKGAPFNSWLEHSTLLIGSTVSPRGRGERGSGKTVGKCRVWWMIDSMKIFNERINRQRLWCRIRGKSSPWDGNNRRGHKGCDSYSLTWLINGTQWIVTYLLTQVTPRTTLSLCMCVSVDSGLVGTVNS